MKGNRTFAYAWVQVRRVTTAPRRLQCVSEGKFKQKIYSYYDILKLIIPLLVTVSIEFRWARNERPTRNNHLHNVTKLLCEQYLPSPAFHHFRVLCHGEHGTKGQENLGCAQHQSGELCLRQPREDFISLFELRFSFVHYLYCPVSLLC